MNGINSHTLASLLATALVLILLFANCQIDASADTSPILLSQSDHWTTAVERDFYSRDQGSQIMLLQWFAALKQPDGKPFLADSLSRYGYLPNEASDPPG